MPDEIEFGDDEADDVLTAGDSQVDWARVEELKSQIDEIQEIEDPDARLEASKQWAKELQGDV